MCIIQDKIGHRSSNVVRKQANLPVHEAEPERQRSAALSLALARDGNFLFVTSPKQIGSLYPGVPFTTALAWFRERPGQDR
jgi:hypothetical protein